MGEAAAAGAAPHSEAAADPEAATNQRVPEAAREVDPSAPGSAPRAPQGQRCIEFLHGGHSAAGPSTVYKTVEHNTAGHSADQWNTLRPGTTHHSVHKRRDNSSRAGHSVEQCITEHCGFCRDIMVHHRKTGATETHVILCSYEMSSC